MSRLLGTLIAVAVLATAIVGTVVAVADEPDAKATTGYYLRSKTYTCTGDVACFPGDVVIRCKAGDFATGGAGWRVDNPGSERESHMSQPWRKNGAARGWIAEGQGIGPDDQIIAQVICARQG